jgi:hypothetical protein
MSADGQSEVVSGVSVAPLELESELHAASVSNDASATAVTLDNVFVFSNVLRMAHIMTCEGVFSNYFVLTESANKAKF